MKFLIEKQNYLSKYDSSTKLFRALPKNVYHATTQDNINSIIRNGLKNAWIGCDIDECITYVEHNHNVDPEDIVVIQIPKNKLNVEYCDFTEDVGDGHSDMWSYTFIYKSVLDVKDLDSLWMDDEKWYYLKNIKID